MENPRQSGISMFPDRPRDRPRIIKTGNRRHPRSSGLVGVFLFSRRVPQISAMVGDYSRHKKTQFCAVGDVDESFSS